MKKFITSLIIIFESSIFNYSLVYAAGTGGTGGESKYNTSFYTGFNYSYAKI